MPREFNNSVIYTVKAGDSLGQIAATHGVGLSELIGANQGIINDPNLIQVGWELLIPGQIATQPSTPPAGFGLEEYVVQPGDSLGALAESWATSLAAIVELNGIVDPSFIVVGQRLRRPNVPAALTGVRVREKRLGFSSYPLDPPAVLTGGFREDYGGYLHRGIDIGGVPVGTPIRAPATGTVTVHSPGDGWGSGGFGICVVLDHAGTPWWSIYAHMDRTDRSSGETVGAGEILGFVGFTGRVSPPGPAGAHLHWQVSADPAFPTDFQYIANPLDFLDAL